MTTDRLVAGVHLPDGHPDVVQPQGEVDVRGQCQMDTG